jgi:hypothetical protein
MAARKIVFPLVIAATVASASTTLRFYIARELMPSLLLFWHRVFIVGWGFFW